MKNRLIELLKNNDICPHCPIKGGCDGCNVYNELAKQADYLIENNVVALPCKLGDTVWYISTENPFVACEQELKARPDSVPIQGILITEDGIYISTANIEEVKGLCDEVNKDYAYLSEEIAEKAIAELKECDDV